MYCNKDQILREKEQIRSEQDIAAAILRGDIASKKYLYSCYVRYLTAVAARYVTDDNDLRDVLQESFLKIFSSIGNFEYRGEGSLKAWMCRIVVNESVGLLRKQCRFEALPDGDDEPILTQEETDIDSIPLSELHRLIRELPPGYRTILNLYVFEEKSHREIAEQLNIKESTSASQFHRAKALLADKIKKLHKHNLSIAYEK